MATSTTSVQYRNLVDLPEPAKPTQKKKAFALAVIILFVAAAVCFYIYAPSGKDATNAAGVKARAALTAELKKISPVTHTALLLAGAALLLAGRRLYTAALFMAGALMGGFLAYTIWTSLIAEVATIAATTKMYVALGLAFVGAALLGSAVARMERIGTALVGACAGAAGGFLLYPVTLDHFVSYWWGQDAFGFLCAVLAGAFVFKWEGELLAVTTSGFGSFAAAVGGAKLFFHYTPSSADFQQHWGTWKADGHQMEAGVDKDFWVFLASVLGLFVLGLLVQLKLDPACSAKEEQGPQTMSFYAEEVTSVEEGTGSLNTAPPASSGARLL